MSYILDALNKAEQERKQRATDHAHTVPTATTAQATSRKPIRALMLLIIIAATIWFVLHEQQTVSPQQPVAKPTNSARPQTSPQATTEHTAEINKQEHQPKAIPHLMALAPSLRAQIPPIHLSAHVYSDEASKRMVIINGHVLREHQYLAEDTMLYAIHRHSIELTYKGTHFTMKVRDSWPPD